MKTTPFPSPHHNRGGTLLIVMGTIIVLGIALASVLALVLSEHRVLARTAAWNAALPAAEAGIEEALSQLTEVNGGNLAVNGWVQSGKDFICARKLSNSKFAVAISSDSPPIITSIGYVWCPSAGKDIERTVQVTTESQSTFSKALVTQDSIKMNGTVSVDSFDSSDPKYSTNGTYFAAWHKDNGDIASNKNAPGAIDFKGKVTIFGSLETPPAGTVNVGGGAVGSTSYISGGGTGIQTDHYNTDLNVSFPSAEAPYSTGSLPGGAVIGGVTYKYVLKDGIDYSLSTLKLSGSDKVLVEGKARLLVDKDVSVSGTTSIQINSNASLALYVKSGTIAIGGQSVFNLNGYAANFSLYGLPAVTDISISGNGGFLGTIYAPQAALKLSGGGSDVLDFVGAAIVKSADVNGLYKFHYDEALKKAPTWNLVITSWKEF